MWFKRKTARERALDDFERAAKKLLRKGRKVSRIALAELSDSARDASDAGADLAAEGASLTRDALDTLSRVARDLREPRPSGRRP